MMKIYTSDKSELMDIEALERDGNLLVIKCKAFGTMPITAVVRPGDARQGLRLLNFKIVWFLLTFLFRAD
jgi:hypothetical protein